MKLIANAGTTWWLFRDGQELFLEVACEHAGFAISRLIRLDADETHAYRLDGDGFLDRLARVLRAVGTHADATATYGQRDVAALYAEKIATAHEAWDAAKSEGGASA